MKPTHIASALARRLLFRAQHRDTTRLGFILALALWAILVIAGSAIALAAGPSDSAPSTMTPSATMPGAPSGAAIAAAPVGPVDPSTLAPGQAAPDAAQADQQAVDNDEGRDLDNLLGAEPPTRVRVAILNATGKAGGANKVAVLLGEYKRQALEDQIGLQIEVVNLSNSEAVRPGQSILFYRPEFLRAALAMAKAIPGEQFVEPMRPAGLKRAGVDVEIVVGKELP